MDKEIAKKCPHVDVVIGAHSHTFLYTGDQPDYERIIGPYPTIVIQGSGKEVPVVQAYAFTKYLGKLELSVSSNFNNISVTSKLIINAFLQFNENGDLVKWGGQPILLNGSIESDPKILDLLDEYRPAVNELIETLSSPYGMTNVHLDGFSCPALECNLGNLISDAMVYALAKKSSGKPIAFIQSGYIQASIRVGNITKFDLMSVFPFNRALVVLNVTGDVLRTALEHSVELYNGKRAEFLQMSGLRVEYNLSMSSGHRVTSIDVICSDCDSQQYEKFDVNRVYGILLPSFLYEGGDGFDMFRVGTK